MNIQQELQATLQQLEAVKAGLKAPGGDVHKRNQMESKLRWLEAKVDKLRRKSEN